MRKSNHRHRNKSRAAMLLMIAACFAASIPFSQSNPLQSKSTTINKPFYCKTRLKTTKSELFSIFYLNITFYSVITITYCSFFSFQHTSKVIRHIHHHHTHHTLRTILLRLTRAIHLTIHHRTSQIPIIRHQHHILRMKAQSIMAGHILLQNLLTLQPTQLQLTRLQLTNNLSITAKRSTPQNTTITMPSLFRI